MHACSNMKTKYPLRKGMKSLAVMAGLAGVLLGRVSAGAQTFTWTETATGSYNWSGSANWSPSGPPSSGSDVTFLATGTSTMNISLGGVNTVIGDYSKPGAQRIDIYNTVSAATLTADTIFGTTANTIFRSSLLTVNVQNLEISNGTTYFGTTSNSAALYLNGLTVSGTTSVTGGSLLVNVQNITSNTYSLGLLATSDAGTVTLANRPGATGASTATANVFGLSGTSGTIQATSTGTTTAVTTGLVITNTANYASGAVLRDGSGLLPGALSVTKAGSGTQTLSGASTYSGGTTIAAGTLLITSTNGVGTGAVSISEGVLHVNALSGSGSITNAVTITDGDGGYVLERANGTSFSAYAASSDIVDGRDTTASILAGTASAARTLTTGFDSASSATNDGLRASDVFSLNGTGSDLFVLQLEIADLNTSQYLGWLDGTDTWVNAVSGNTGNNASAPQQGYLGSFANFQIAYGTDLSTYVGAYGVDDSGDRVWAVLNHNSDFAVIPEPSTWLLLGTGLSVLLFRRRIRR